MNTNKSSELSNVQLLFIGSVLPDKAEFHTNVFSRAGVTFQQNLLTGIRNAGLAPSGILSVRHVASFPRTRRLFFGNERVELDNGMLAQLMPFFNISPLKQLVIGFSTLIHILSWGRKTRYSRHRVVYTYNLTVPPALFTLVGARLINAKAFVSLNDINRPGQTVPNTLFNRFDYWLQKKLIPFFDGHIVVADSIMADFAPDKAYVRIEGGVTEKMISKTDPERRRRAQGDGNFTIVSIGLLNEANGFNMLLKSFALLKSPNFRLYIAGSGALANEVCEAAALDPRITYFGMLSQDEVFDLYNQADLLLNLRLTKQINTEYFFPSKMMEYLVSGRPVLTTCTGHVEDEFGGLVFLLKNETPEALADMLQQIASLEERERTSIGDRAREYMCSNKTWDAQGKRVSDYIYRTLSSPNH